MSPVSVDPLATNPGVAKRGAWMALGRIADQGVLGFAGLLLASRLSVADYAPVALILVAHSVAGTLSDLGLAHEMLRLGTDDQADRRLIRSVRAVNLACIAIAIVLWSIGLQVGGLAVALWACNSEAMLRQSSVMLDQDHRRLGLVQTASAVVMAIMVVVFADSAVSLGLVLGLRVLLEVALLPAPDRWFSIGSTARTDLEPLRVLVTHGVGFGNRNVDFLIGAPFLGTAGFARYVFAYRLANAGFAPVGTIATRLGIAELAGERSVLEPRYRRGIAVLFVGGCVAGAVTAGGALLVPHFVGDRWAEAVPLILLLTVALPFRFIDGIISPLLYVSGRHGEAVRLELVRLLLIIAAVATGALLGVRGLAIAMSGATIVTVWAGHRWAASRAGIGSPRWLSQMAIIAVLLLGASAVL